MKKLMFILVCVISISLTSCYTTSHTVGAGSKTGVEVSKKQWYAIWGLVPINHVDSKDLAGGATDYSITTQHKFLDLLISAIGSYVTIEVQTVTVKK